LVVVCSVVPFPLSVTVTFAFATAAPEGSVTVPIMLPKTAWAEARGIQNPHTKPIIATTAKADLFISFLQGIDPHVEFTDCGFVKILASA
jgi:hypothetical protein